MARHRQTAGLLCASAARGKTAGPEKAQQRYINHVREGVRLPSVWEAFKGQIYLGDEKFIDKMNLLAAQSPTGSGTSVSGSRRDIPNIQRRPQPTALDAFERQHPNNRNNRNAAVQTAFATGAYTMAQLAQHFQMHYTGVRRIVELI